MRVGTRSVLFGYHCFFLHPFFVAWAWFRMHGFGKVRIGDRHHTRAAADWMAEVGITVLSYRRAVFTSLLDYRLWVAFFVHDIGYWGKPNMDGAEGETHPEVGARFMRKHFGEPWGEFCLYHSRFYAKRDGRAPSMLCYPDKMAFVHYPTWLTVLLVSLTGEVKEYMQNAHRDNAGLVVADGVKRPLYISPVASRWEWAEGVKRYVITWVAKHKDGAQDHDTPLRTHA